MIIGLIKRIVGHWNGLSHSKQTPCVPSQKSKVQRTCELCATLLVLGLRLSGGFGLCFPNRCHLRFARLLGTRKLRWAFALSAGTGTVSEKGPGQVHQLLCDLFGGMLGDLLILSIDVAQDFRCFTTEKAQTQPDTGLHQQRFGCPWANQSEDTIKVVLLLSCRHVSDFLVSTQRQKNQVLHALRLSAI